MSFTVVNGVTGDDADTYTPENDGFSESGDDDQGGETEGSQEPHKEGKEDKQEPVSCELCKQRKVKCDRVRPCNQCVKQKNEKHCTYLPRKKPGLRAGYGKQLEARLDRIEASLLHQDQELRAVYNHCFRSRGLQHITPQQPTMHRPPIYNAPYYPPPASASSLQQSLPTYLGPQIISQTPVAPQGYHPTVLSGPQRQLYTATSTATSDTFINSAQGPASQPAFASPTQSDNDSLPYSLQYRLFDLFFQHIYPWCPILHQETTKELLFGQRPAEEADRNIMHAIVATTLKFCTDPTLSPEQRNFHYTRSKEKVILYGIQHSSVKSLQALVILALDVIGSSNGPPGWNILTLITRSVVQLGLSMERHSPAVAPQHASIYTLRGIVLSEPKDWIEEESRRRLFWMIYVLDRYATVATAFDFALEEKDIDRRLPCRDELFENNNLVATPWFRTTARRECGMDHPESLGPFSYYVEILGVLSRVHQFLKKPVNITSLIEVGEWQRQYMELDGAIEAWKRAVPAVWGHNLITRRFDTQNLTSGVVMLHAAFHTTTIRLHSSGAYPTHRSPIFIPSYSASRRCLAAAESLIALCTAAYKGGLFPKLGPPFIFSIWVAARVLLVHGSTVDRQVDDRIGKLVKALQDLGKYWSIGTRYAELLSRVLGEYYRVLRAGGKTVPPTLRILADMRRCAFDLDYLISRQLGNGDTGSSRPGSAGGTPSRTPGSSVSDYFDVFDFFDMPRLPTGALNSGGSDEPMEEGSMDEGDNGLGIELNITNYMVDASSDWLMRLAQ